MNKIRRKILKCLYDANKARASMSRPLVYIKDHTKIDIKTIGRETDYLYQKGYIKKQLITTPTISAYSYKIAAHGIDEIEKNKFLQIPFAKTIAWIIVAGIPLLGFYLDFFSLKTKIFALFTKKSNVLVTKEQPTALQPIRENQDSEKVNKQKIARIQINRIIEDASSWLGERIKQNISEIERIKNNFASRNVSYSGGHVTTHINRVNEFIKSVNDYIKEMNRKIEDILLGIGEEKFEAVVWLKDEYKKYTDFLERAKAEKNGKKQQNEGICLTYTDKLTYDSILKANPYTK